MSFGDARDTQKIINVDLNKEVRQAFLDYSMSVITSRALPDVRDGLKPVHRRILYTMHENGLTPDKAYRKCADTVGSVLGRYHPHGDASVYDAMVRLAQTFSMRYVLVDGHGNFGSVDGDPPAAYRYTESRMSKMALRMLTDIDKDTVDFTTNYDDRLKEPTVLPSRYPNLLVNGSVGIAVGMATNIPPHNLGEVIDGMCAMIDNPDIDLEGLMEYIKGPDFPTKGLIMGRAGIRSAYATGRGKITVRAKAEIVEKKNGKFEIQVTEIPYMVKKADLIESIANLVKDKKIEGISDVNDYSSKKGMLISIDLKRDANPQVVLNQLFSYTQLQNTFGAIMIALVNGEPKQLSLKEILSHYIKFQEEVITRRTRYDLKKAQDRAHILEGLAKAIDIVDDIIATIRACKGGQAEAKAALMEKFEFDEPQAAAIVAFRLGQLAGLEILKIMNELDELKAKIAEFIDILNDEAKVLAIVKAEAMAIRDKFADERRTEIINVSGEVDIEDLIPEEECVLTKTVNGYIKRLPADTYNVQNRGGRGITGMTTREDDIVENMFVCSSHDYVMLFSNLGRMYRIKAYEIPEGSRTSKGMNMVNIVPLMPGEKITVILPASELDEEKYIAMVTKKGTIKRTKVSEFRNTRRSGIIAISIDEDDELAFVRMTDGKQNLFVATKNGLAIQFKETDVRAMGRNARGVRAINMRAGDEVVDMAVTVQDTKLLTITETGYGRISPISDYRIQSRGGKGLTNYRTEKYGRVAATIPVTGEEDIIMIASNGIVIRIFGDTISEFARPAKGVRVMRVAEGERILSVAKAEHDEAEVNDTPEEADADAGAVDSTEE